MSGLEIITIFMLVVCAGVLALRHWILQQPMPDALDIDEEQDDERSERNRY